MPCIDIPAATAALTATGGSTGILTIADTTPFFPGAFGTLSDGSGLFVSIQIMRVIDSTHLQARTVLDVGSNVSSLNYEPGSDYHLFVTSATASLALGTIGSGHLNTVVQARSAGNLGNTIIVQWVGDSGAGVTITESGRTVTIHYQSGVSTVANVETAITGSSTLISVQTPGTAGTVLTAPADNGGPANLSGGKTSRVYQDEQTVRVDQPQFTGRNMF